MKRRVYCSLKNKYECKPDKECEQYRTLTGECIYLTNVIIKEGKR